MSTRRNLFGHAAGLAAIAVLPIAAQATVNPEADMIRLCSEHVANLHRYNTDQGGVDDPELDPVYHAYVTTLHAVDDFKPRTLEGMKAKALAARAEARMPDGSEDPEGTMAAQWAWELVLGLLAGSAVA